MSLKLEDQGVLLVSGADGKSFRAYVSTFICEECGEQVGTNRVDVELAQLTDAVAFRTLEDQAFKRAAEQAHRCVSA